MRKIIFACVIATAFGAFSLPAHAQLNLKVETKEPVTGLDSDTWANMERRFVNVKPIIGKPVVYMLNATPDIIVAVNCESWQLVGNKPYIEGNPDSLPAWSATLVNAKGFDGYCKNGVTGMSASGDTYRGTLNAANHSFSDSTFVTFTPKNKQ